MARRRKGLALNGWLNIDKDSGMTSAQVVAAVRRITNAAKAGHAGTLDPLATGVLPIALGEATKSMTYVLHGNKSYRFTARWGESRDTDDEEGQVTASSAVRPDAAQIRAALPGFRGDVSQTPPAYSAVKVDGRRAYDLARQGEAVKLRSRIVSVYRFELMEMPDADHAIFEVDCGTGTYVRALVRDLAQNLGTLGHIADLRRTRSGPFGENSAISLDKLRDLWQSAAPAEILLPIETALDDIPALALTGPQADRLRHGQAIRILGVDDGTVCAMASGRPVAIALAEDGEVRPLRVFNI